MPLSRDDQLLGLLVGVKRWLISRDAEVYSLDGRRPRAGLSVEEAQHSRARELLGKRLRAHVAAVESARSRLRRAELSRAALGDAVAASERTFGRAREQLVDAARALCAAKARGTALAAALGAVDDDARWAVVELGAVLEDHG